MNAATFQALPRRQWSVSGLTQRQRGILCAIVAHFNHEGGWPTVRDLMRATGIKGPMGIQFHLAALMRDGWITRPAKRHHGVRVVGLRTVLEFDDSTEGRRLHKVLKEEK